ncbi:thioredoxin domain-containing protein [Micromonospora sp. DT81.3]|uniref:thioredoxin domain-containing protein n=1 Tax=Micromonospora sp. DT81.3 TaxID=3416523 RepID=UPI003CF4F8D1
MASRLADTVSPYLRAHADNPVAWFPWGAEAFAEAARRDVPVLVSIGYSTCHWCHVMARESFADADTAAEINRDFVAIKVDREEHPEVDSAYMAAASAFTQNLGWPLTVFTTPDGRPFYAGTYWPPQPHPPMPSFRQVLAAVHEAWSERRADVEGTSAQLAEALASLGVSRRGADALPSSDDLAIAARRLATLEDVEFGGFGTAGSRLDIPKFPTVPALRFLQAPLIAEIAPGASAVALRALDAMIASPLRDPVDGGFFRYATRRDWTVPHFERMLTDNAGLIDVALDAGKDAVAADIAQFLLDTLQQPSGGFGAAQDSESWIDGERSEGGYYARDAVDREPLEPPAVDGKVITGWNGLAIGALARAGLRLDAPALLDGARRAADAVLESNVAPDGRLIRASLDEIPSRAPATIEDYGLLADGLAALAAATGEVAYAVRARQLVDDIAPLVRADAGGEAVDASRDPVLAAQGLRAPADESDGTHPSGRSALASAALSLWLLGAGESYRALAETLVQQGAAASIAQPMAHGSLLRVACSLATPPRQLVVVGGPSDPLVAAARRMRTDVTAIVSAAAASAFARAGFELFEGKGAVGGVATAYDCRSFACRLPVTDAALLDAAVES